MIINLQFLTPQQQGDAQAQSALWLLEVRAVVTPDQNGPSDSGIFVYRRGDSDGNHIFHNVASASQLRNIPGALSENHSFFRHNKAVLLCRSFEELNNAKAVIRSDCDLLVRDWNKLSAAVDVSSETIDGSGISTPSVSALSDLVAFTQFSSDHSYVLFYDKDGKLVGKQAITLP